MIIVHPFNAVEILYYVIFKFMDLIFITNQNLPYFINLRNIKRLYPNVVLLCLRGSHSGHAWRTRAQDGGSEHNEPNEPQHARPGWTQRPDDA